MDLTCKAILGAIMLIFWLCLVQLDLLAKTMYTLAQQIGDTAGMVVRELLAQLSSVCTSVLPSLRGLRFRSSFYFRCDVHFPDV